MSYMYLQNLIGCLFFTHFCYVKYVSTQYHSMSTLASFFMSYMYLKNFMTYLFLTYLLQCPTCINKISRLICCHILFLFLHTQHKELKNLVQGLKEEEKIHDIHKTNLELYIMSKNNLCQKLAVTCHLMKPQRNYNVTST